MFARLALAAQLLVGTLAAAAPHHAVEVSWGSAGVGAEQRALIAQVDRALRDELRGCGPSSQSVVLRPSLEVSPRALKLSVVVMRTADRKLLGTISAKAAGSSRDAQLRALVTRVCRETISLSPSP